MPNTAFRRHQKVFSMIRDVGRSASITVRPSSSTSRNETLAALIKFEYTTENRVSAQSSKIAFLFHSPRKRSKGGG
ncbi:hypothetical protein BLNAU_9821 [Blattamonas nauphoetae]|uniref:Uncharacterized protein n=1 Tax=Blattamonas nauphoetae TaxID=2049346 RepID=A0ABQ9XUW4_9EUKA|nr:hypothetical protein BLNAU_9821 [Blattamonas nauphoetae]